MAGAQPSALLGYALAYGLCITGFAVCVAGFIVLAGKTTTGRLVVRELRAMGYRVAAVKLTGAARYQDIQSFAGLNDEEIIVATVAETRASMIAAPRLATVGM